MNEAHDRQHQHRPVMKTLWPSTPGTMKLTRQFGDALVCVRYRHDGAGKLRYTTVELVVEQTPIQPRASERMLVSISHPIGDRTQRARAMALGAKWDQQEHVWKMSLRVARMLDVLDRIVAPESAHQPPHNP